MKIIPRSMQTLLVSRFRPGSAIVLSGPKGVGKTQFLKQIKLQYGDRCIYLNAAHQADKEKILSSRIPEDMHTISFYLIDEAHNLNNLQLNLEALREKLPHTRFLIALDGMGRDGNPRLSWRGTLFPLTEREYHHFDSSRKTETFLAERLVYGNYPRLMHLKTKKDKRDYLEDLLKFYLEQIRLKLPKNGKDLQLLRMFSYLVGEEIFYREMEHKVALTRVAITKLMQQFSEMNLIIQLKGFKRNLKKEVGKHACVYFLDNGIRNAVINNFNPVRIRNDSTKLWKNYLISERIKQQHYRDLEVDNYFWRTYDQQELDWVEEKKGQLVGYRFTLDSIQPRVPHAWKKAYPQAEYKVINPENYREWLNS